MNDSTKNGQLSHALWIYLRRRFLSRFFPVPEYPIIFASRFASQPLVPEPVLPETDSLTAHQDKA